MTYTAIFGIWLAGFCIGVGLTGKLMEMFHKRGWTPPKPPHISSTIRFPSGYEPRKR